jgi:hypothetical protein
MNTLFEQIKNVPEAEMPADLRVGIKKQLLVIKFRFYLLVAFSGLALSFVFLSLHVYGQIVETDALIAVKALMGGFEFSFDYLSDLFDGLNELLPLMEIMFWVINLGLVFYAIKVARRYRHQLFNY